VGTEQSIRSRRNSTFFNWRRKDSPFFIRVVFRRGATGRDVCRSRLCQLCHKLHRGYSRIHQRGMKPNPARRVATGRGCTGGSRERLLRVSFQLSTQHVKRGSGHRAAARVFGSVPTLSCRPRSFALFGAARSLPSRKPAWAGTGVARRLCGHLKFAGLLSGDNFLSSVPLWTAPYDFRVDPQTVPFEKKFGWFYQLKGGGFPRSQFAPESWQAGIRGRN